MNSSPFKNSLSKLDPYSDTDCEMWAKDILQVLLEPFRNENQADGLITKDQSLQAEAELKSQLVWFYQTHL